MAKGKGCKRAPEINGELSTLYLDLFKLVLQRVGKDKAQLARLITNVLYVHYESNSQLKDSLDNMNKQRNKQGQHEAADVFQALNGDELITYSDFNALDTLSISEGIKVDTVTYSTFTTWQQAYQKALDINTNHPNLSAYVIYKGGSYQVKVNNKTPINMVDRVNTEVETKQMELIDNTLASINVSLDSISFEADTYFGKKFENLVSWIKNTPLTDPKYLLKKDLKVLVSLFQNETIVDRLITKFGGIDAVVDTYYDWYRGNYTATPSTQTQLLAAMDLMHTFKGLDTYALYNTSKALTDNIKQNSTDYNAYKLFDQLNQKYKLALATIQISKKNLDSLTKLLEYTIGSLGHQAKAMRAAGDRASSAEFMDRVRELDLDLENKEYTQSLASFLSTMSIRLDEILNNLTAVIPLGADINFILERGTWYRRAELYLEVYEPVVENIMKLQNLDRDIQISDADVAALQQAASNLFETIVGIKQAMARGKDAWAKQAISLMMAENSDLTLDLIMETISQDASWMDRLWNPNSISNIPAAVLVNYILSARRTRTQKMAEIALRITQIANMTSRDTRFMYEKVSSPYGDTYYITSEYDWEGFNKARGKRAASLKKKGVTGGAFDVAMERWMLANTEEIVVDKTNGRTERVPRLKKQVNPLDSLSPAQRKAYDEFLQLKAELESLLPEFALNLYRPPQLRKSTIDLLTATKNPLTNLWRASKEAYQSTFGVREDEVGMGQIIDTDTGEIVIPHTNMVGSTDTVPINYILTLKEQEDLLHNFAEGISHLAESAINYDSMSEIMDTVEVLSDYINDKVSPMLNGALMAKGFFYGVKTFWERINSTEGSNVNTILQDQKQRMLYNNNSANRSIKATKRLAFLRRVTSINALTFNVFGALNNLNEAHRKVFEEALVKNGTFGLNDLVYAYGKIGWGHIGKSPKHFIDFFTGRKECVESLLMERFDVTKDKFRSIANKKYRTNFFRKAISNDYSMIMYSIGETQGRMLIAYSTLHSIKAIVNGKKTHLTKAFEAVLNPDGTYSLKIKQGATLENGEPITEAYLDQVAKNMNATAEATLGGMSDEALGQLGTTALGMMTLHLRRWMVGVLSEYFRGSYYNAATGKLKTGAWKGAYDVTLNPLVKAFADADGNLPWSKNWAKDMRTFALDVALNYKKLRPDLIAGASRFAVATGMMTLLSILTDAFLKSLYPKHHDEEWFKIVFYLLMRLKMDVAPTAPDLNHIERIGLVGSSIVEIMDKPYASASTVKDYIGLVRELDKMGLTIERGPHEGEDRYWRHFRKTLWKPGELWNRIEGLEDTDELINSLGGFKKYSAKKEYEMLTGLKMDEKKKKSKKKSII